ncbi:MAG: carotenoid 1,2-hydratase [Comamonadaceae bacterium]|nr:carotenoid 1,2-hydratase [Burkholderiales bacterium]MEB2348658.1 carotenoid 1,2-hydratase [Comamonadaceae bacterium]
MLYRRQWLLGLLATGAPAAWALQRGPLRFPRDHGSHPSAQIEWWYLTGQVRAEGRRWGFQITFFRSRVDAAATLRSAFAARQLLFAHAALTDVEGRRLLHDERIARTGFGVAQAREDDTAVRLHDWSLVRDAIDSPGASRYAIHAPARGFALELVATSTQPLLLQGDGGYSRKGPLATQASWYVSQPQLAVEGVIRLDGRALRVEPAQPGDNRAWMDHEWSDALLAPEAVGWDWIGINLADGGALTAFVLRRADGNALWAGGSLRGARDAAPQVFAPAQVRFTAQRHWTSPRSGVRYPVQWQIETPAGRMQVRALVDDQELDSRASTGAIYWEGLSALLSDAGREIGLGYLEMTGYAAPLQLK